MFLALVLFVGIPVLGTGAWTGILASSILELDFKESIGACFCGVLLADVDDAIFWTLVAAGFAGGMATAFYGLCSVVLPPIAHLLTTNFGIQKSFEIVGAVCGAVICAGGLLSFIFVGKTSANPTANHAASGLSWREMIATKQFWKMLFFLCCGAVSGMMIISHSAGIAGKQVGLTTAMAATAELPRVLYPIDSEPAKR